MSSKLKDRVVGDNKLIVSYTSYPARISTAHLTAKTILRNSIKPDMVILWLAEPQFPKRIEDLPSELVTLVEKEPSFKIKFVDKDIRQFKKLRPALQEFPNDYIITIDDDRYYSKNLIKRFLKKADKHPGCIVSGRARLVKVDNRGNLSPFNKFSLKLYGAPPRFCHMAIGNSGILFPPKALHVDALDEELFERVKPESDDLWNWAMAVRNGTKIKIAAPFRHPLIIRGTQKDTLCTGREKRVEGTKKKVKHTYTDKIVENFPEVVAAVRDEGKKHHGLDKKLVVSFTSYPARIHTVHIPIQGLLNNRIMPDLIVLQLAKPQFPNGLKDLPKELQELLKREALVEVRFQEKDIKQHKKHSPTMREFPEDFILSIDDDREIPPRFIERFLKTARKHPKAIVSGRLRYVKLDKRGNISPFNKFNWRMLRPKPRYSFKTVGSSGIFFPPKALHPDMLDEKLFDTVKPDTDEFWIWTMAVRNGTKITACAPFKFYKIIPGSQECALMHTREKRVEGTNKKVKHTYVDKIVSNFPEVLDILRK